jgi:hypothetical protein
MTVRAQRLPSRRLAGMMSVGDLSDRSRSAATTAETSASQAPRSRGAEIRLHGWRIGPQLVAIGPQADHARPLTHDRSPNGLIIFLKAVSY